MKEPSVKSDLGQWGKANLCDDCQAAVRRWAGSHNNGQGAWRVSSLPAFCILKLIWSSQMPSEVVTAIPIPIFTDTETVEQRG